MSHSSQRQFVELVSTGLPEYFVRKKVLEIGSLNLNGSVRDFFQDCDYLGLDVSAGKDVDMVCEGQNYSGPDNSFNQVISCEVMEHNPFWKETLQNMLRLCAPGGLFTLTCATTGRPEHGTTRSNPNDSPLTVGIGWDYYLNLTDSDFASVLDLGTSFVRHKFWVNWSSFDLFFLGIKSGAPVSPQTLECWDRTISAIDGYVTRSNRSTKGMARALVATSAGEQGFKWIRLATRKIRYSW